MDGITLEAYRQVTGEHRKACAQVVRAQGDPHVDDQLSVNGDLITIVERHPSYYDGLDVVYWQTSGGGRSCCMVERAHSREVPLLGELPLIAA